MSGPPRKYLTEDEAARLWRRAAELQAEAARRQEARAAAERSDRADAADSADRSGFEVDHVTQAAVEAGIGAEYVRLALAELDARATGARPSSPRTAARIERFLRHDQKSIEVSEVIRAAPAAVLDTMQRILPAKPYELTLKTTYGGHPLGGGVLVFEAPGMIQRGGSWGSTLDWSDMKEFLFTLKPVADDPGACELTVVAPLDYSRRLNFWVGIGSTGVVQGIFGFGGFAGGAALGSALGLAGAALGLSMALPALAGIGAAGWLGRKGYRSLYRHGIAKGEEGLQALVRTLAFHATTGIRTLPARAPAEDGEGSDDP